MNIGKAWTEYLASPSEMPPMKTLSVFLNVPEIGKMVIARDFNFHTPVLNHLAIHVMAEVYILFSCLFLSHMHWRGEYTKFVKYIKFDFTYINFWSLQRTFETLGVVSFRCLSVCPFVHNTFYLKPFITFFWNFTLSSGLKAQEKCSNHIFDNFHRFGHFAKNCSNFAFLVQNVQMKVFTFFPELCIRFS